VLRADAALLAIASDGVYLDIVPQGRSRYVLVTLIDASDAPEFGRTAYETKAYSVLVIARSPDYGAVDVDQAAFRVHELLHDQSIPVPAPYALLSCIRTRPIRRTEHDAVDPSIYWLTRGGEYQLQATTE